MKHFTCYFHFLGFWYLQLGFHLFLPGPNLELHVPFGFFKLGWEDWDYYIDHDNEIKTVGYIDGRWGTKRYGEET